MSPRDNFRAYISNRERERRRETAAAATARQREGSGEGEGDRFSRACRDYASANSGKHTIVACSIGSPFSISGCARRVLPLHATLRRTLRFLAVHARARVRARFASIVGGTGTRVSRACETLRARDSPATPTQRCHRHRRVSASARGTGGILEGELMEVTKSRFDVQKSLER